MFLNKDRPKERGPGVQGKTQNVHHQENSILGHHWTKDKAPQHRRLHLLLINRQQHLHLHGTMRKVIPYKHSSLEERIKRQGPIA